MGVDDGIMGLWDRGISCRVGWSGMTEGDILRTYLVGDEDGKKRKKTRLFWSACFLLAKRRHQVNNDKESGCEIDHLLCHR